MWGITTYFNPARYRSRLANYRGFREASHAQGLPLVTVELTRDGEGELEAGRDAEVLVTKTSGHVLWHKERLLNLAIQALPPECKYVCWIDADVVFERDDWIEASVEALQHFVVIQPFTNVIKLPRDKSPADYPSRKIGWSIRKGRENGSYTPSFGSKYRKGRARFAGTTGFAWCARREPLDAHGFYDRCIIGGGDREIALACVLATADVPDKELRITHPPLRADVAAWHDRFYDAVRGDLGAIPGAIHHLWHGEPANRSYTERHAILDRFNFDPHADIVLDENECWAWAAGREELALAVQDYFTSRKEDG